MGVLPRAVSALHCKLRAVFGRSFSFIQDLDISTERSRFNYGSR